MLFLFRVSGIPFLVSEKEDIIFARPYGGIQGVRGAAEHMGPALHGIFVGQGTRALPWVRYGIGGRTGASAPTEGLPIGFRRGRCPHRPASVTRGAVQVRAGRPGGRPLRKRILWCVGEGLCPSRGRGNRRSAASGGCSEAISRKCPDWRPQQWPGIGWHDGGQENPAPTKALYEVQCR